MGVCLHELNKILKIKGTEFHENINKFCIISALLGLHFAERDAYVWVFSVLLLYVLVSIYFKIIFMKLMNIFLHFESPIDLLISALGS